METMILILLKEVYNKMNKIIFLIEE